MKFEEGKFKVKKVGLCICYNVKNYGSMLQAFATCKALEKNNIEYEIIRYAKKPTVSLMLKSIDRIPEKFSRILKKLKEKRRINKYAEVKEGIQIRNKAFEKFEQEKFNHLSQKYNTYKDVSEGANKYSSVVVGSDQLWRPEGYATGFYNLMFVPDNIIKISYATSFGVGDIPKKKIEVAKNFLNRIDFISVREIRAAEIVRNLTNREVPVVADPTLLFDSKEWYELIEDKKYIDGDYIFCYLLGNNPKHREFVTELGKKKKMKIVTAPFLDEFVENDLNFGDYKAFDVGPIEFVNLIRNAKYICTDSFHGSVFSIINHKQFITFNRFDSQSKDSRNSRIDSLFELTGLASRRIVTCEIDELKKIDEYIDYEKIDERINTIRAESLQYINKSILNSGRLT